MYKWIRNRLLFILGWNNQHNVWTSNEKWGPWMQVFNLLLYLIESVRDRIPLRFDRMLLSSCLADARPFEHPIDWITILSNLQLISCFPINLHFVIRAFPVDLIIILSISKTNCLTGELLWTIRTYSWDRLATYNMPRFKNVRSYEHVSVLNQTRILIRLHFSWYIRGKTLHSSTPYKKIDLNKNIKT